MKPMPRLRAAQPKFALAAAALLLAGQAAAAPPLNVEWRGYNNSPDGQRYSPLTLINRKNVAQLKPVCEAALGDDGAFQSGLTVVGGSLYVTTAHTTVALNAADCSLRWRSIYVPEEGEVYGVNRGVAYGDSRVYRGTGDGRILALDASTGKELWRVHAGEPHLGEWFAAAPVAWNGMLFIGVAGGDYGIMGRILALDAATGREIWRFHSIPTGSEPGAESWKDPESAKSGGGGSWTTYTLDPARGELFAPVGNPAADFAGDTRPGENLYTDSMVALDARTGALNWYYQLVANDKLDYDLGAAPMLYADAEGRERVAIGGKDGHLYLLDRGSHALLSKTPITTIDNPQAVPTPAGVHACPGWLGGVEWNGPAYSPAAQAIYVGSVDWCGTFTRGEVKREASPLGIGQVFLAGKFVPDKLGTHAGWVTAIDGTTGKPRWKYRAPAPVVAGVTPTAAGLVFSGDLDGNLVVLDGGSGRVLKKLSFGSPLAGGISTYAVDGRQYIAATTGNISRILWQTTGTPKVVIMATGLPAGYAMKKVAVAQPGEQLVPVKLAGGDHARALWVQHCAACHGSRGEGLSGPPLIGENARKSQAQTVDWIKNPQPPMPRQYPQILSDGDVDELATLVQGLKP